MQKKPLDVTAVLNHTRDSTASAVVRKLVPLVYNELRALAENYLRGEKAGHTLQPTALVHEAFMKLVDQDRVDWKGRTHFYAVCAEAMRRVLVDHARARKRAKRGNQWKRVILDDSVALSKGKDLDALALHDALEQLADLDPQQAQIVQLRFFAGMTVEEVADVLGASKRKVEADWTHAKAWLRDALASKPTQ